MATGTQVYPFASWVNPSQADVALLDGLESAWELNEASGNALDSRGANTLTETNGPIGTGTGLVYPTDRNFSAAGSQRFTIADNPSVSTGDVSFWFEVWIKPASLGTFRAVLSKDNGGSEKEFSLYAYADGRIQFNVSANGTNESGTVILPAGSIVVGQRCQIICWHDAEKDQTGIVKNTGTPVTAAYSAGVRDGTAGFTIGALNTTGQLPFDGEIGPVRFGKGRVPSILERAALYNGGAGLAYSSFTSGRIAGTQVYPFAPLIEQSSGTVYPQSVAGSLTPAGALRFAVAKALTGSLSAAGALAKATSKPLAGSTAAAGSLARLTAKPLAGSTAPSGTVVKQANKALTGAVQPSGTLGRAKSALLALGGVLTAAGSLARQAAKVLAGWVTGSGALTTSGGNVPKPGGVCAKAGGRSRVSAIAGGAPRVSATAGGAPRVSARAGGESC